MKFENSSAGWRTSCCEQATSVSSRRYRRISYFWHASVGLVLFVLMAFTLSAWSATYNFYFPKDNKDENNPTADAAAPVIQQTPPVQTHTIYPDAPAAQPGQYPAPQGNPQSNPVTTIQEPNAHKPIIIHNINNNPQQSASQPQVQTQPQAVSPPQNKPILIQNLQNSGGATHSTVPEIPMDGQRPLIIQNIQNAGSPRTEEEVIHKLPPTITHWTIGILGLVAFADQTYYYSSGTSVGSYSDREASYGGMLSLGFRPIKAIAFTGYTGVRGSPGSSGDEWGARVVYGFDFEILPLRVGPPQFDDFFEMGILLGFDNLVKAAGNIASLHAGFRVNFNFSRHVALTGALRGNLGSVWTEFGFLTRF